MNYYIARVVTIEPDNKGVDKKKTIKFLVENCHSITEAEINIQNYFSGWSGTDYTIKSVTQIDFNEKISCEDSK